MATNLLLVNNSADDNSAEWKSIHAHKYDNHPQRVNDRSLCLEQLNTEMATSTQSVADMLQFFKQVWRVFQHGI